MARITCSATNDPRGVLAVYIGSIQEPIAFITAHGELLMIKESANHRLGIEDLDILSMKCSGARKALEEYRKLADR